MRAERAVGAAALILGFLAATASASGSHHHQPPPPPPPPPCLVCPTVVRAGNDPGDLQVHLTGPRFDKIEAYFRDSVATEVIPGAANLHCYEHVVVAPESDFGAFALRYGPRQDTFRLFAWKAGATAPSSTPPMAPMAGSPIRVAWVTTRIVKVSYGPRLEGTLILRFDDADVPWVRFDEATQAWVPFGTGPEAASASAAP